MTGSRHDPLPSRRVNVPPDECILCGAQAFTRVAQRCRDSELHGVSRCDRCGLVQLSPLPGKRDHQRFHAVDGQGTALFDTGDLEQIRMRKEPDAARRLALIARHVASGGSVLDVGSGYGVLLARLVEAGYRATGLELSPSRRDTSKRFSDAEVLAENIYALPADLGRFDAVLLIHVLEHLLEPAKAVLCSPGCSNPAVA
jgi:SAM-dependent methyltransferase